MNDNKNSDNIVYFARLNWILFLAPVASFVLFVTLWVMFPILGIFALILTGFSLIWIVMTWVTYYFSSVTIQKKQVILRMGMLVRQTIDIPLAKIETIDIRQSIIGSLFRYGTLIIIGTGGSKHSINFLDKPLTCRRYIEQLMNDH